MTQKCRYAIASFRPRRFLSIFWRQFLLLTLLLHAPPGSRLVHSAVDGRTLTLGIATTNLSATCTVCGHETWRLHSRYPRSLAEEPVFGHQVRLQMTVR